MFQAGGVAGLLLFLGAAAGGPNPDAIPEVPTREKLQGKWFGPKGTRASLEFKGDKVLVTYYDVPLIASGVLPETTFKWDYAIEPKTRRVVLAPIPSGGDFGSVEVMPDGTLRVFLRTNPPMLWEQIAHVAFERAPVRRDEWALPRDR